MHLLKVRGAVHGRGGSVLVPQDPLSTVLSLTMQMINSIDAVTQDKVFRQDRDTIGICFIIAIAKILLLAMGKVWSSGRKVYY